MACADVAMAKAKAATAINFIIDFLLKVHIPATEGDGWLIRRAPSQPVSL